MIVDDRLAFVGSENFSATSLDKNRELRVIVRQPAAVVRLESTFRRD
jgi:phosphatidylserine/phosphatidylglycerophosphate/cardiolipin synthase-like enzyme